ncbi:cardiolipin synthase [Cohnella rhizosphaerae]|uniref:Cardiolipin synthase n=1 Tax=Cohnella rhizosphaerae TaxID=1457232 RepID=A0A9X4L0Z3_9BACL|nr:cardiolipin synthase [Cohnella rhizosphaerae]MDG0814562.1 cardiolipin synthase [Cohnella rhizosphaerae]
MSVTSILLGLLLLLNMVFAVFVVFQGRRDIGSTWAWLLVLYFIPILGFIMYLFLAQDYRRVKLFKWGDLDKIGIRNLSQAQLDSLGSPDTTRSLGESAARHADLIHLHLKGSRALWSRDNEAELLTDGRAKFDRLLADIAAAKESVHFQTYIFRCDELGMSVLKALTAKAKQGVKVRLLYDELGSRRLSKRMLRPLIEAGGEAAAFFPSRFRFINLRMNNRNHRKLVIVDGRLGYIGGFNVGDEYLGLDPKFGYWRDTHLRVRGSAVHSMQTRFILDWNQAARKHDITYTPELFPEDSPAGDVGMQIVASGPNSRLEHIKQGYIKMIASAKHSIYLQSPYFIPDASLLDALRIAVLSGVHVHVMIPDKPDHMFIYWATLSNIGELLEIGANVYLYKNGFIHAKTLVVDQEIASVGTANTDVRSFKLNFEVNAFVYDADVSVRLVEAFKQDIAVSELLTIEKYRSRPLRIKFKEAISRLLSPIL